MMLLLATLACTGPTSTPPKDTDAGEPSITDTGEPSATDSGGESTTTTPVDSDSGWVDADGDGAYAFEDCDDTDPTRSPMEPDTCNGVDDNCDGAVDEDRVCDVVTVYDTRLAVVEEGAFTSGWMGYLWVDESSGAVLCSFVGEWTGSEAPAGCPGCDWAFALTLAPPVFEGNCAWIPLYEQWVEWADEVALDPVVENWGYVPFVTIDADKGHYAYENMYTTDKEGEWTGTIWANVPWLGRDYVNVSGSTFEWGNFPLRSYYYHYEP